MNPCDFRDRMNRSKGSVRFEKSFLLTRISDGFHRISNLFQRPEIFFHLIPKIGTIQGEIDRRFDEPEFVAYIVTRSFKVVRKDLLRIQ